MKKQIKKIVQVIKQRYSDDFWKYHIVLVVNNSLALTDRMGDADKQVVEMAAYLHDIGRFKTFRKMDLEEKHHIIGAQMAKELLEDRGYEPSFIEQVGHCILTHRGKKGPLPKTIEAKIVACADAMAHFDAFFYMFKLFLDSYDTFEEAISEMEQKMLRDWQKLTLPEARRLSQDKYEAIMLLIKSIKTIWGIVGS